MRDLFLQQLGKLLTSDTMGVKGSPEPLHYTGPEVDSAAYHPIGDGLHRLRDLTKNS